MNDNNMINGIRPFEEIAPGISCALIDKNTWLLAQNKESEQLQSILLSLIKSGPGDVTIRIVKNAKDLSILEYKELIGDKLNNIDCNNYKIILRINKDLLPKNFIPHFNYPNTNTEVIN